MATAVQKITLSSSRDIPFNKLALSQSNVRRVKAGVSIEDLAAFHVVFGKTVPDMLKSDLAVEYKVDGELKKAIAACEKAQDYVTREMLVVQLDDTEMDHAYFLEKQLKLIELVGLENYQQSQMGSTPV